MIMNPLFWGRGIQDDPDDEDGYLGSTTTNLNLDPDFESRLDALMRPEERVALLLGLIHEHRLWAMHTREGPVAQVHLLVRKPDIPSAGASSAHTNGGTEPQGSNTNIAAPKINDRNGSLQLSEAQWVRQRLQKMMSRSIRFYRRESEDEDGLSS
jgi:hypothetical protein